MTAIRNPLRATIATAAAAVALSAAQFAGIDALATPHGAAPAAVAEASLPLVVVTASRLQLAEVHIKKRISNSDYIGYHVFGD